MLFAVQIAPGLSFADIANERVALPDVYQRLVETWILDTADTLLAGYPPDKKFSGMAALSLLLQFFEPHAEMLKGCPSRKQSREFFCYAFQHFLNEQKTEGQPSKTKPLPENIYRWARCGLFHNARLSPNLLVDGLGLRHLPFYENPGIQDGWLVNPAAFSQAIRKYLANYTNKIKNNPESDEAKLFIQRMTAVLKEPLDHFRNNMRHF